MAEQESGHKWTMIPPPAKWTSIATGRDARVAMTSNWRCVLCGEESPLIIPPPGPCPGEEEEGKQL